jgi:hypothetical protein
MPACPKERNCPVPVRYIPYVGMFELQNRAFDLPMKSVDQTGISVEEKVRSIE